MAWAFTGRTWRVAWSLRVLGVQVDDAWPNRRRASDGTIGDTAHQSRTSDHNPWVDDGVVTAIDITHDPLSGADMGQVSEAIRLARDPRVKYVIFNRRMFSSYPTSTQPPWAWRPYSGPNPHTSHMHVSVQPQVSLYDNRALWPVKGGTDLAHISDDNQRRLEAAMQRLGPDGFEALIDFAEHVAKHSSDGGGLAERLIAMLRAADQPGLVLKQ